MNKEKFIEELSKKLNCNIEFAGKINNCLEDNFIIGKKNKEKTINTLIKELNITLEEADNIYNISMDIITGEIKNKLKNPFKDLD